MIGYKPSGVSTIKPKNISFGLKLDAYQKAFDAAGKRMDELGTSAFAVLDFDETIYCNGEKSHIKGMPDKGIIPAARAFIEKVNRKRLPFCIVTTSPKTREAEIIGILGDLIDTNRTNFQGLYFPPQREGEYVIEPNIKIYNRADMKQPMFAEIRGKHPDADFVFVGDVFPTDFPGSLEQDRLNPQYQSYRTCYDVPEDCFLIKQFI